MEDTIAYKILLSSLRRGTKLCEAGCFIALSSGLISFIVPGYKAWCFMSCVFIVGFIVSITLNRVKYESLLRVFEHPEIVFWVHGKTSYVPPYRWLTIYATVSFHLITGEVVNLNIPQTNLQEIMDWFRDKNPSACLFNPTKIQSKDSRSDLNI